MPARADESWPEVDHSLRTGHDLAIALQKDPAEKLALNIGGTEGIRGGQLPNRSGFDYASMPGLPMKTENFIRCAAFALAILTVFAPAIIAEKASTPEPRVSTDYRRGCILCTAATACFGAWHAFALLPTENGAPWRAIGLAPPFARLGRVQRHIG